MTAFVNYPLTASDDDEFFDAPAESVLILCDEDWTEQARFERVGDGFDWRSPAGDTYQAGELWASLSTEPFGPVRPNTVLRVPLEFAQRYGTFGVWAA